MTSHPTGADRVAVAELQALFHKADPGRTGLLSYSEFALVILRSGGTQSQVDALIDQFAAPSRAQRTVHYEALLDQLYASSGSHDSADADEAAAAAAAATTLPEQADGRQRSASFRSSSSVPGHDALDHSPLPVPPAGAAPYLAPAPSARGYGPSYAIHDTRHAAAVSHSPLMRSVTHAGGGTGSRERTWASRGSAGTPRFLSSASPPLARRSPHERGANASVASSSTSHFVASALRAASATRPVVAVAAAARAPPRQTSPSTLRGAGAFAPHDLAVDASRRHWLDSVSTSPSASRSHSRDGAYRSALIAPDAAAEASKRQSSVERMTRAAAAAAVAGAAESKRGARRVAGSQADTAAAGVVRRGLSTSVPTADSTSRAGALRQRRASPPPPPTSHVDAIGLCNGARAAGAPAAPALQHRQESPLTSAPVSLLSLRDIFHRHLASAPSHSTSLSVNASTAGESTVLLSALEEALVARGVEVHPLELEALADSLEPCATSSAAASLLLQERSGLDMTNTSSTASAATTTRTGGADRPLTLVDFCVLVSRLRPALIRHIRSPGVWATHVDDTSASGVPRGMRGGSEGDTNADADGDEAIGDSASIMDVTVSPMTSATASPSPLRRRLTRTRDAVDPQRGPPATPPTARQLSSDRHFAVQLTATTPPSYMRSQDDEESRVRPATGYSQPTASSQQRRAAAVVPAAHPSQRRSSSSSPPECATAAVAADSASRQRLLRARAAARGPSARPTTSGHSPLSSTSRSPSASPSSASPASARSTLAPRVLEELQGAALRLLRRCAREDPRHTGRMPFAAWARVLRDACPSLTGPERQQALAWLQRRLQSAQDAGAHGCEYAALVEDVLAEASVRAGTPGSSVSASPPPAGASRHAGGPGAAPRRRPASLSPLSTATTATDASPTSSTRSAASPRSGVGSGAPPEASASAHRASATRATACELAAVCGGDTDALLEYFRAFDTSRTGVLDEHVWRASLEELYRRTAEAEVPAWVLGECLRLARAPFRSNAALLSPSAALAAARARAARVPSARRRALCDYRYALEELGLARRSP